jgi:hypothetical protein
VFLSFGCPPLSVYCRQHQTSVKTGAEENRAIVYSGDVNGDGLDIFDAQIVYDIYMGVTFKDDLKDYMRFAADVNGDESVDTQDVLIIWNSVFE